MSKADFFLSMFKGDIEELCHIFMLASLTGQIRAEDWAILDKWVERIAGILKNRGQEIPEDLTYHFPDITKRYK